MAMTAHVHVEPPREFLPMHFSKTSYVSHTAADILDLMMNRMDEVVPYMPSIESIELKEKQAGADGTVRIVRYWQGSSDSVPVALRAFVSKDLLGWTDTAIWHPAEYKVEWDLATSLSRLYECGGTNYFEPDPKDPKNRTRIRITGNLAVHPERLPGVPRFIAARLGPQIETWILEMLTPNLTDVAKGLQGYFDATDKKR